jgi:phage tail-like protein
MMLSGGVSAQFSIGGPAAAADASANGDPPWHAFRFHVEFVAETLSDAEPSSSQEGGSSSPTPLVCKGAFSDVTGLEATMEPKVIREGGRNYGAHQRVGAVNFATVVLKRGMTSTRHLWDWFFQTVQPAGDSSGPAWGQRLTVYIVMQNHAGEPLLRWRLKNALPVKFKAADLSAKATEVAIEELHLAHEGLGVDPVNT